MNDWYQRGDGNWEHNNDDGTIDIVFRDIGTPRWLAGRTDWPNSTAIKTIPGIKCENSTIAMGLVEMWAGRV